MTAPARAGQREVFIALGSNLGDRLLNLNEARRRLAQVGTLRRGPIIETTAVLPAAEREPQPRYLNTVDGLCTELPTVRLFERLQGLERAMGRARTTRWAPRIIDVDLVLDGALALETETLTVPHPRLHERRFVLEPLVLLEPEVVHPRLGRTVRQLLDDVLRREATRGSAPRALALSGSAAGQPPRPLRTTGPLGRRADQATGRHA